MRCRELARVVEALGDLHGEVVAQAHRPELHALPEQAEQVEELDALLKARV